MQTDAGHFGQGGGQEGVHHRHAVWAVRLTPNGKLLAAAGYDMTLTLYDTMSQAMLQQIRYSATSGPHSSRSASF